MNSGHKRDWLWQPDDAIGIEVSGTDQYFPVHRVFCVGRNYVEHAKEMNTQIDRSEPFYFSKSVHSVVASGSTVPYPPGTNNFHHEIELVLAIGGDGFCIE